MRGTAAQGREELAGQQFCHCAWILCPGQVRILHQMGVSGETTAVTIFRQCDPAGIERPYCALVITDGVEERYCGAEIARAPVGGEFGRSPAIEHRLGMQQLVGAIPGSYRGKDGWAGIGGAVGVAAEGIESSAR